MPEKQKALSEPKNLEDFFKPLPNYGTRNHPKLGSIPDVRPAPMFRKGAFPLVVGQPEKAKLVEDLLGMIPEARGDFDKVTFGPTQEVIESLIDSDLSPFGFRNSNLLGMTYHSDEMSNPSKTKISLNPLFNDDRNRGSLLDTLVHEMKHAHGMANEKQADEAGPYYPKTLMNRHLSPPRRFRDPNWD